MRIAAIAQGSGLMTTTLSSANDNAPLRIADRYFAVWAVVLPISTIVLLPIQGTTPAYLMGLALLAPPVAALVLGLKGCALLYRRLLVLALIFVLLNVLAQVAIKASGIWHLGMIQLMDRDDRNIMFRRTMITQSIYLLPVAVTFIFVRYFYRPRWDRFLFVGVILLAMYGLYEIGFFTATGMNGDFLSNRSFASAKGSLFQTIGIGPLLLQRLKSLTGEPSMYAFTVLPFCIYAWHTGRKRTAGLLFITLLLTFSTTAAMGMACYLAMRVVFYGPTDRPAIVCLVVLLCIIVLGMGGNNYVIEIYEKVILEKFQGAGMSGRMRMKQFEMNMSYFQQAPLLTQIFGLGFGYARGSNMFSALLLNLGVLGWLLVTAIFFIPVFSLGNSDRERGLRAACVVAYVTMMVAVPEFSYLSTWLFLGMAYNAVAAKRAAAAAVAAPPENAPAPTRLQRA
ncbi:MAG TPA: hypothetical protein VJM53_03005 [Burkholderiales bacterium]|nr:hypothetical protein [Burkholderiales bacterium]